VLLPGCKVSPSPIILDVAGGKGDLSWLLTNVDSFRSVVVDPRITKHQHLIRSIRYLQEHPDEALKRAIPNLPTHQPLAALVPLLRNKTSFNNPLHLRLLVDESLVRAVRAYLARENITQWTSFWKDALERAQKAQPLGYREREMEDDHTILNANEALDVLLSTKLVVAFHPDQATEAALDLALCLKVPFCIVPCCVFPSEFPNRRTNTGQRLRTYDEFLEYLLAKDAGNIKTAELAFVETPSTDPKRIVLYRI
jgi:hypothetical protein